MATALRPQRKTGRESPSGGLKIVRARARNEVDLLEAPWRDLNASNRCPSSQFAWTRACLTAFSQDATSHVVVAAREDALLAVAPLVRKRWHGVHRLFLAGVGQLHEPTDLVWADDAALRRLARVLASGASPLVFERMRADSPALAALARAVRGRAIVIVRPQAPYPYIALDESWVEPEQHLNPGRRSDLRRARRKAECLGQVTTEIHSPGLHELPRLLDTAFEVEAGGWKGEAGTALAKDLQRAVFYRQYAEAACVEGVLRICFLRIGDRVAAMQVAIELGGGFWLLKVGYDDRFAACSPGQLLLRETIRYAAEAALSSYEFWGQSERWTQVWTTGERPCVSMRTYPFGPRGAAALVADAATTGWHKWRNR